VILDSGCWMMDAGCTSSQFATTSQARRSLIDLPRGAGEEFR